jgi:hypothetical protein
MIPISRNLRIHERTMSFKRFTHSAFRALRCALFTVGLALAILTTRPAQAGDYAPLKTFWSFRGTWTNGPTIATNLAAAGDFTQVTDFSLAFIAYGTNAAGGAGSFDLFWETSLDGSNWPGTTNQIGRTTGWFSVPMQTNSIKTVWVTNITLNAIGYWRLRWLTNQANMNYTNIQIAAYGKPKRTT